MTLPETGLFGDVDLREATVFAYRANGVLAALDRSPHSCRQRDILSPGDFRVGRCNDTYGHRVLARLVAGACTQSLIVAECDDDEVLAVGVDNL
jgi:hypothetical protein